MRRILLFSFFFILSIVGFLYLVPNYSNKAFATCAGPKGVSFATGEKYCSADSWEGNGPTVGTVVCSGPATINYRTCLSDGTFSSTNCPTVSGVQAYCGYRDSKNIGCFTACAPTTGITCDFTIPERRRIDDCTYQTCQSPSPGSWGPNQSCPPNTTLLPVETAKFSCLSNTGSCTSGTPGGPGGGKCQDTPRQYCSRDRECARGSPGTGSCSPDTIRPNCCKHETPILGPGFTKGNLPCEESGGTSCPTALGDIKTDPQALVKDIFRIVLSIAGGLAVLLIIMSGYRLTTSQGDPERIKGAQEQLTAAIIGLLFIIFSFSILSFIGVDILNIFGQGG